MEISCHTDTIYSLAFNYDGSQFVTTSKDKKIRVIDARSGSVVQETDGHKGAKSSRAIFTGSSGKIFTTGFSRMNERQFGVWDPVRDWRLGGNRDEIDEYMRTGGHDQGIEDGDD